MQFTKSVGDEWLVQLSRHELMIIADALNEVCHTLGWEFEIRMGSELVEVEALHGQIITVLKQMSKA